MTLLRYDSGADRLVLDDFLGAVSSAHNLYQSPQLLAQRFFLRNSSFSRALEGFGARLMKLGRSLVVARHSRAYRLLCSMTAKI